MKEPRTTLSAVCGDRSAGQQLACYADTRSARLSRPSSSSHGCKERTCEREREIRKCHQRYAEFLRSLQQGPLTRAMIELRHSSWSNDKKRGETPRR